MIIYFYLLIALKILTIESSSIRDRTLKNDLVSFLSPRADLGRKDSNSLKIISQEPFIIQLGVSNGLENVNTKDDIKERKRKRPAKKRFSKLRSLRKKHRIRREVKASDYKRTSDNDMRKSNQTERLMTDEAAKNLLVNITSKQLAQDNSIKRHEMFQALTQAINETQQELDQRDHSTDKDLDKQIYEWLKAFTDKKQSSHQHQSSPMVGMVHQLPRKTDKNQAKYTYQDLMTDRDRLEQKIKYLKNYMSSNDSKIADDGSRVRRKSETDKVNKMAKMFLTLSAVNDRKKMKCKEEEDDYDGDLWSEERRNSPLKRTSSSNEERYKVKKWIEHLKSKRSSRSSCPCQNNGHDDETDIFPLELKVSKDLSSRDLGETSEESSETYRGYQKFLDYPYGKSSRASFYKPRYPFNNEDLDNKLSTFSKRGRRKFDLPLDDLEAYRSRAKLILQNAEEILDRIKDEEEKRRATPGCLANHLKELTSRIQGDPRNSENDLIKVIQKTLGWDPLTNPVEETNEGGKDNEEGSFPHNKWSILDPYEKAKALTEENTRQLSSYLLRNLGKLGGQTIEQPEQVEESKPSEPEADEKTQIYQGQVPQDKDSVLSSDDLRKENGYVPDGDQNQPEQGVGDVPTTMIPESKGDLLKVKSLQNPIKDKIKEILDEQRKKLEELAGKKSAVKEQPDDLGHSIVTVEDYLDKIDENRDANPVPWKQSVGSPEENDENPTNLEQVEAVSGNEGEKPANSNQDDQVESVKGDGNTETDDKPTDPGQEEEDTSKLLAAPKNNFMDADSEDSNSKETTQDQVLQEKEAFEGDDKRSDLDDDDQVEAVEGKENDETLSDVNQNDKVEATLGEENIEKDEKTTELTEDDKVEAIEGKSNEQEEKDPKEANQDDKVEAVNSKETTADEEVEAVQGKSNEEEDEDPKDANQDDEVEAVQGKSNEEEVGDSKDLNQEDKVEAISSKENREEGEDDEVEAVQGKSNEEDEDSKDLNQDDKVEAINTKEDNEKTEDEVEAVQGKSNEEGEDPEDLNQDDKVEATNSKEKAADEEVEALQDKSNEEEDDDSEDVNQDDEVEAVQGKSNDEEDADSKYLNQDDKVEAINSKEDNEKTEDEEVAAIQGKDNEEGEEDPTELNQEDKVEAVEGGENTESDEKLTDPNQKLRVSKPLKSLKKNFKNVNSDDKTEDYKSGESTQDPVVKQENEKERSSEDEDANGEDDFINRETPKASSIEDEETQQKDDESDVIASQHLSKSEEQDNETEPDVTGMSNSEDSETTKLTNEDLTVAEPEPSNLEELSESQLKPKENEEDENDETNQDNVAVENPKSNRESDEDDPKDEEQIPDLAAAENPTTSQENKSEEPNDPLTGKTLNSDEETSEANDRDENDLIASKHLNKANEQDGVASAETVEELKDDDNTDDPSAKEHVSKTEEMIQPDSTESGSSSKETEDDDSQVGSEKVGKLGSTENDESKSLESQGVPDEKDPKTIGVPEKDDQILEAQKTDGEDSLRAEGLARVIENILGKEESIKNEDGEDSKDGMIQSAQTTDENPTEVVKEQSMQPDDSTSGEIKPLLTYSKVENKQNADPESSETSDELIESSQHNPEVTSRESFKQEDWSIETGAPHHQSSELSEENISEEPHLGKSINDDDWSPETESPHHQTSKSREPSEEPNIGKPVFLVGGENSESEENLDYENPNDDTLRAANPVQDDQDTHPEDDSEQEGNLRAIYSDPKTDRKIKLSVPRSVGDIMKDLNDGKIKYGDDMSSLDPEKIDYFIDKIDKAERADNDKGHEVDCRKECACADEIDTRSRKIGRYEIVKDILHWMKDLQMNRVLSDN